MAKLPVKVQSLTVAVPPFSLAMPPPKTAELLVKVLSLTVAVPLLSRPPPLLLLAELLVKVLPMHRRRTASLVVEAAAVTGGVAGEGAAADRDRPEVFEAAAVGGAGDAGVAAGDG